MTRPPVSLAAGAPARVLERLRSAPDGVRRVVHAGPLACYVDLDGLVVGVVAAGAAPVPCALRTRAATLPDVGSARVEDGRLVLGDRAGTATRLVVGRVLGVAVPRRPDLAARVGVASAPDPEVLVGRGEGLTPLGDDVLCGWLAVARSAGLATPALDGRVRAALPRTTLLSATLLDCALRGEVVDPVAAWLRALGGPEQGDAARAVLGLGATSGAGMLAGARRALGLEDDTDTDTEEVAA